MKRRRDALLIGACAAACAPYARLVAGGFPEFVAERLGMETELATELAVSAREHLGPARYVVRATAFAIAAQRPLDRLVPRRLKRMALVGFVRPLLRDVPDRLAYALGRASVPSCGGLLPPA